MRSIANLSRVTLTNLRARNPALAATLPATSRTFREFHGSGIAHTPQTFKILGLQQIAIGALDKGPLSHFWGDLLGLKKVGDYRSEKENVDEDIMVLGSGPTAVEVDLMQPIDAEKSPKVHIPSLNHIGLWVDNIENAVSELTEKGVKFAPGGIRKGASGHKVTFIHPKSAVGVLVELVQAPDDVISFSKKQ